MSLSANVSEKAALIWAIADKLTGVYKPHEYGEVILPLTVIRRFDCILADTKDAVLEKFETVKNLPMRDVLLRNASGKAFYNTSKFTFERLLDDPDDIEANFRDYLNGFSENVQDILEKFKFDGQITTMANKGILYIVIKEFTTPKANLHPDVISNLEMGYIFEEIIRRFSESHNEDAGQHYTPREVIQLMVNILFYDDNDLLTHADTLDGYKICKENDLVMNIMLAWKRALGVSEYTGIVSPAYCIYRGKQNMCAKYFHYLFRTDMYANLFKQYSTGIIDSRLRLYPDKFLALKCQVPPIDTQRRIADYLDRKCSQIDTIIARQQEVIEKLKAYKLSVITEAVTKGVNPDVPMKDSGVEWIGEIPEHWENRKMISILSMRVVDGPHESPELYDEGIPYISATAIENGKINFDLMRGYISEEYCDICDLRYKPQLHDILVIKLGASTGQVAIVETTDRFNIWVPLAAVRCNEKATPYFVYYAFQSDYFLKQMEMSWTYGTQQTLGVKSIERLRIILPTLEEQKEMVSYLKSKCDSIDAAVKNKENLINKLADYKKSLIYEVVTGKKEV